MRVLMTADTAGGVWTYALELGGGLVGRGHEVELATMGARLGLERRTVAAQVGLGVHESAYRLEWMEEPWNDVERAGAWLLGLEQRLQPDVVHLNGYVHGSLPWGAPTVVVGHSDVLSWWRAVHGADAPPAWDRYRQEVGEGLAAADAVVAPTRAALADLEAHYPLPEATFSVPNGRDPASVQPLPKEPFVLSAGRLWDEAKNVRVLEHVAADLPWPVVLAGDGAVGAVGVQALGHVQWEELARWLGRASIYAAPALYEPFGLGALEAGLAGCALVLGDVPSLRETWGDDAVFVDGRDDGAVRAALCELIADGALRRELGRRARRRALQHGPAPMAGRYLEVYAGVLAGRPATV